MADTVGLAARAMDMVRRTALFADVRRMIQQNRLVEAEELLDGTPSGRRDGEWHYLKGTICYQRGWLDDARNHFGAACQMNPTNPEYRAALNRMNWQGTRRLRCARHRIPADGRLWQRNGCLQLLR